MKSNHSIDPAALSASDAATFLGISERLFYQLVQRGDVRAIDVPGVRRKVYAVSDLRALFESWRGESAADVEERRR